MKRNDHPLLHWSHLDRKAEVDIRAVCLCELKLIIILKLLINWYE